MRRPFVALQAGICNALKGGGLRIAPLQIPENCLMIKEKVFSPEYLLFGNLPNWKHFSLPLRRPAAIRWAVAASGRVESIFSAWFNCTVPREPSPDLK